MIQKGNYYYKSICIWNNETKTKKQIPIKLAHKDEYDIAMYRKGIVETTAKHLKRDGQLHLIREYVFEWNSESGKAEIKKPITLAEGLHKFIDKRDVSENTMCMNINSFNHLTDYLSPTICCLDIEIKHLLGFINRHKHHRSDTSINIDLRALRTLLLYLKDMGELKNVPSFKRAFKMCPINHEEPIHITEVEFIEIMSTDWMLLYIPKRDWYKEVFHLYWDIGVRLSEPFFSTPQAKYVEQARFLAHVIEDLRLWLDKAKVKYPKITRKYFTFSPEYSSVTKHGINYPLTRPQAAIIQVLYIAHMHRTEHLNSREIFHQANDYLSRDGDKDFIESVKISDVFKSHKKTYSALITRDGQSHYRLNLD